MSTGVQAGAEPSGSERPEPSGSEHTDPLGIEPVGVFERPEPALWWRLIGGCGKPNRPALIWGYLAMLLARLSTALRLRPTTLVLVGLAGCALTPIFVTFRGGWLLLGASAVLVSALAYSAELVFSATTATSPIPNIYRGIAGRISEAACLLALWLIGVPGIFVIGAGTIIWLEEYALLSAQSAGAPTSLIPAAERGARLPIISGALLLAALAWQIDPTLAPGAATVSVAAWLVFTLFGAGRLANEILASLRAAAH